MSVMGFQKKFGWRWMGGVSSIQFYLELAGYPASLGPLPPVRPSLSSSLQSVPPSFHPRITRLRQEYLCVIVHDNCFPESYFEILTSKISHRGGYFFIDFSTFHVISRTSEFFYP